MFASFRKRPLGKVDIINQVGRLFGYRSYLEMCTPISGLQYGGVDKGIYRTSHRLMYNCPPSFRDGLGIDFRSDDMETSHCIPDILQRSGSYDVVFVDGYHLYRTAYRDLCDAVRLLAPSGTMVVHDCLPVSAHSASADFVRGNWSGRSFKAFVDLLLTHDDLAYVTVDTDHGCGIVRKAEMPDLSILRARSRRDAQAEQAFQLWPNIGRDDDAAFPVLEMHKGTILNLISDAEFKRRFRSAGWFGR